MENFMDDYVELTDGCLDELFAMEIGTVTRLVDQLFDDKTTIVCRRWFNILQKAKPGDKFARNFVLLMLHRQLNEGDTLTYPFTDVKKSEKLMLHKWNSVLKEPLFTVVHTFYKNSCIPNYNSDSDLSSAYSCDDYECLAYDNKHLLDQNVSLFDTLKAAQARKGNLINQMAICKYQIDQLTENDAIIGKEHDILKEIFTKTANTAFELITKAGPNFEEPPKYFATLFSVFGNEKQNRKNLEQMDLQLTELVRRHIYNKVYARQVKEIDKAYDMMHDKAKSLYKVMLLKEPVQLKELSLKTLKYLMLLSSLFVETFKGHATVRKAVLQFIQQQFVELSKDV